MDVIDAIKSRRSVRAWTVDKVTEENLQQILESGRWSPSPLNSQPWHFVVIKNKETIEALCKDAREGSFLKNADICIVISTEKEVINPTDFQDSERISLISWLKDHDQYEYSAVCALLNMWLTAWNLGIGGTWVTVDRQSTQALLGIPENEVIIGSLALGHILGNPVPHRETDRKPLSEFIFFERYGQTNKNGSQP